MKKYRTAGYDILIEEVEVLRETGSSVYISQNYGKKKEQREAKLNLMLNQIKTPLSILIN